MTGSGSALGGEETSGSGAGAGEAAGAAAVVGEEEKVSGAQDPEEDERTRRGREG